MSEGPAHSDEYNRYAAFLGEVLQPTPLRRWLEGRARSSSDVIVSGPPSTLLWCYLCACLSRSLFAAEPEILFICRGGAREEPWMLRIGDCLFDLPLWLSLVLHKRCLTWQEAADAVEACVAQERMGG